jgi:hypothetical protein
MCPFGTIPISDPGTNLNVVAGNLIGIDSNLAPSLGNGGNGIQIADGAQSNSIGGSTALANTIDSNAVALLRRGGVTISAVVSVHFDRVQVVKP